MDISECHWCHQLLFSVCAQQRLVAARPTPQVRPVPPADTDTLEAGGGGQGHTAVRNAIQGAAPSPRLPTGPGWGLLPLPAVPSPEEAGTPLSPCRRAAAYHPPRLREGHPAPRRSTSSEVQHHGGQPAAQDPGEGPAPKSRGPGWLLTAESPEPATGWRMTGTRLCRVTALIKGLSARLLPAALGLTTRLLQGGSM